MLMQYHYDMQYNELIIINKCSHELLKRSLLVVHGAAHHVRFEIYRKLDIYNLFYKLVKLTEVLHPMHLSNSSLCHRIQSNTY